jgi:hypothetical protein
MEYCTFCKRPIKTKHKYLSLPVCKKCYFNLKLNQLKDIQPPSDEYMKSIVEEKNEIYVDHLNIYSTLQPKTSASDLFGIFFANLDDEEMDDIFIISMIIAARSVWLFGNNKIKRKKLDSNVIHTLHTLGNMVSISIMGNIAISRDDLNVENDKDASIMCREIDTKIIEVLQNLMKYLIENDDGALHDHTLHDYIIDTIHLIQNSEKFR